MDLQELIVARGVKQLPDRINGKCSARRHAVTTQLNDGEMEHLKMLIVAGNYETYSEFIRDMLRHRWDEYSAEVKRDNYRAYQIEQWRREGGE